MTAPQGSSPAGKGQGRKVRMNGGEESDGVVVPMKQANNATEKQAEAAEFVEGRTPTKDDTG